MNNLNPTPSKLDRPFDIQTSLSRTLSVNQLPLHTCKWCDKPDVNIIHENTCELNPENVDKNPVCGNCGGIVFPRIGGFKCVECGTMSFPRFANAAFINSKLITFDALFLNPVF